jgi:microcystin-dependent protein
MAQAYVGECRLVGFNFGPYGWLICQGQILPISQYEALFNLIGTTYGGNGASNFQLPDLRGRVPVHQGQGLVIGQPGGMESVTLITQQLPSHSHALQALNGNGTSNNLTNAVLAQSPTPVYVAPNPNPDKAMNSLAITNTGNSLPHENRQPFLAMNWIISLFGIFPTPN